MSRIGADLHHRRGRLGGSGQIEIDRGADADRALDRDVAAGLPHEAVDHAEAEPCSPADLLCGEERLEDPIQRFRSHAATGIFHREPDIWPGRDAGDGIAPQRHVAHLDLEGAATRHRVARVQGQIEHVTSRVGPDRRGTATIDLQRRA